MREARIGDDGVRRRRREVAVVGLDQAALAYAMAAHLIAGGDDSSLSVRHGIEYLLETQRADGSWEEKLATGTGFPKVFYLNYHLYKDYFPLLALSSFVKTRANSKDRL